MKKLLIAFFVLPLLLACGTKVERMDVNTTKDLSGKWNDTDSRLVAETMIQECLNGAWYAKALRESKGKEPVVIVGTVNNDTMEHINTGAFIEELQRALINSGKVEFVASSSERGEIRQERLEQDEYASEATRKAFGQEVGADYMLSGVLSSIVDQEGRKSVVFYQVNLKLINIETNKILWNGQKQIKKYVAKKSLKL
ncbi:penicillin-binding protein activator LpoB [Candidatus Proelusimicrobium excrementi]|uniref:penicillin-binding protein activator LpoB n=1 Tax=Candidatus Proelusimicrobium excrementi TaxID=3416222 RepID=UPI003C96F3EA|nr:penicillin-binding protein activator LpoB [Elusimicrobiaceae bacterium]